MMKKSCCLFIFLLFGSAIAAQKEDVTPQVIITSFNNYSTQVGTVLESALKIKKSLADCQNIMKEREETLKIQVKSLTEELTKTKDEMTSEKQQLNKDLDALRIGSAEESEKLKAAITRTESELTTDREQLSKTASELQKAMNEKTKAMTENKEVSAALNDRITKLEANLETQGVEYKKSLLDFETQKATLEQAVKDLTRGKGDLQGKLDACQRELQSYKDVVTQLKTALSAAQSELGKKAQEITSDK